MTGCTNARSPPRSGFVQQRDLLLKGVVEKSRKQIGLFRALLASGAQILTRILEHELIHYKLWYDQADWGHSEAFRQLAWTCFGHQSITHGIGAEEPL